jgi:predicted RNA binding protein YcfA (HicA-like mRNA interferase family)
MVGSSNGKPGWDRIIRLDYHGSKEVPTGTCHHILKAAGITSVKGE